MAAAASSSPPAAASAPASVVLVSNSTRSSRRPASCAAPSPTRDARDRERQPLARHQRSERGRAGAEREANRQFAPALVDDAGQQAVDPDRGEHPRQQRKRRQHEHQQPRRSRVIEQTLAHRLESADRQRGIERANRGAHRRRNRGGVSAARDERHRAKRELPRGVIHDRLGRPGRAVPDAGRRRHQRSGTGRGRGGCARADRC